MTRFLRLSVPLLVAAFAAFAVASAQGAKPPPPPAKGPKLTITPASVTLGPVDPGVGASQEFVLGFKDGKTSGELVVTAGDGFAVTDDACTGTALKPGQTCTVTVTYTPSGYGESVEGTLTVTGKPDVKPASALLFGSSTAGSLVSVFPDVIHFGEKQVGASDMPQSVTFTNNASEAVWAGGIDAPTGFAATGSVWMTCDDVAPGATCSGAIEFNPAAAVYYEGTFTITWVNAGNATVATTSLYVDGTGAEAVPVNQAPTADSQQVSVDQDTATEITLTASDLDGESVYEWAIVTGPAHGTLSWSVSHSSLCDTITLVCSEKITYTPAAGFLGEDSFTFTADDGKATSSAATVSILVGLPNRAPTVDSQTGESAVVMVVNSQDNTVTLTGHDDDGDDLAFGISTPPANGTLGGYTEGEPILGSCSGTPSTCTAQITYSPTSDYVGSDSFSFYAYDGELFSDAAADISITVNAANSEPTADPQSGVMVSHTSSVLITLSGSDPDGDSLTFGIPEGSGPAYGTLSDIGTPSCTTGPPSTCTAEVTYYPNGEVVGQMADEFTFAVNDGKLGSTATVSIDVTNEAPTATAPMDVNVPENWIDYTIGLTGADLDGDDLSFVIDSGPGHGTLGEITGCSSSLFGASSLSGITLMGIPSCTANVAYTPTEGYVGSDSFTFHTYDGWDDSEIVSVSINVVATEPS